MVAALAALALALVLGLGGPGRAGAATAAPPAPSPSAAPSAAPSERERLDEALHRVDTQLHQQVTEGEDAAVDLRHRLRALAPELFAAALLLAIFYLLQRAAVRLIERLLQRARVDPAVGLVSQRLTRYAILAVGVLAAARQLGLEVGELLAGVGIVGLGVSLAAQDLLSNLIAGFTSLIEKPFRIGDSVTVAGMSGEVLEIGLRFTKLRTPELREVYLPNREVVAKAMVNNSAGPRRRLDLRFVLTHGETVERVRALLLTIAGNSVRVLADPPPRVVVVDLNELGVAVELRAWLANPNTEFEARFEMLEAAQRALGEAGVELARPVAGLPASAAPPGGAPAGGSSATV